MTGLAYLMLTVVDARCMIRVGIQGKSTTSSWYEVWEAVTALVAICVRAEKGGKVYRIGLDPAHLGELWSSWSG